MLVSKKIIKKRIDDLEKNKQLIFNHLRLNINTPHVVIDYSYKLKDIQIKINEIKKLLI
jgi:hypothetical protein